MCVKRPMNYSSDVGDAGSSNISVMGKNESYLTEEIHIAQSLTTCKMTCGTKANLWPYPTGSVNLSDNLFHFLPVNIIYAV